MVRLLIRRFRLVRLWRAAAREWMTAAGQWRHAASLWRAEAERRFADAELWEQRFTIAYGHLPEEERDEADTWLRTLDDAHFGVGPCCD